MTTPASASPRDSATIVRKQALRGAMATLAGVPLHPLPPGESGHRRGAAENPLYGSPTSRGSTAPAPSAPPPGCFRCGRVLPPSRGTKPRKWCSESCRVSWYLEHDQAYRARHDDRERERSKVPPTERPCAACQTPFIGPAHRKYCSDGCRHRAATAARRARTTTPNSEGANPMTSNPAHDAQAGR